MCRLAGLTCIEDPARHRAVIRDPMVGECMARESRTSSREAGGTTVTDLERAYQPRDPGHQGGGGAQGEQRARGAYDLYQPGESPLPFSPSGERRELPALARRRCGSEERAGLCTHHRALAGRLRTGTACTGESGSTAGNVQTRADAWVFIVTDRVAGGTEETLHQVPEDRAARYSHYACTLTGSAGLPGWIDQGMNE